MLVTICTFGAGSIVYSCGTSLIRFFYVRSSISTNMQGILKKNSFIMKSIVICESITLFNIGSFFYQQYGITGYGKTHMVLYHACLDPVANFQYPLHKLMPANHLILLLCTVADITCNLFLYRFLSKQTDTNVSIKEVNKKKERKRNFIPAKLGMALVFSSFIALLVFLFTYNLELESFDSATRAFINAAFSDFFHCISSPGLIIYGFIGTRRKCYEIMKKMDTQAKQLCCGIGC